MIPVCHISTVHRPDDVRIFVRECCSLAESGYEVHLVIGAVHQEVRQGVHIHPIHVPRPRLLRMLVGPWVALWAALKTKAKLYHYHDPELIGIGFILRWLLGKQVVFDIHECVWLQLQSKHYLPRGVGWLIGRIYRGLEHLCTVGQVKVVANAHSAGDYPQAVLVQNFPKRITEIPATPRVFDSSSTPCLVYLGVVAEIRGVFMYLDLVHRLKQRGRPCRLILMGENNEALDATLHERIQTLGLKEEVEVTGRLDWSEALARVSEATIGLCLLQPVPNYTRCLATKILEYMMVGTPVLASDFETWRPFVEGERVGLMADPENLDDVLHACESMLDDPEALTDMSQRGRAAIAEKYNWDVEFAKLEEVYNQVLGRESD